MTDIILPAKITRMLTPLIPVLDLGRKAGPGTEGSGLFTSFGSQWREQERRESKEEGKQNAVQLRISESQRVKEIEFFPFQHKSAQHAILYRNTHLELVSITALHGRPDSKYPRICKSCSL